MASGPSGRGSTRVRAGARPAAGPRRGAARPRSAAAEQARPRPRFTGRAAVLLLVLALLLVSYASSMRAFLEQRHHLSTLSASIAESQQEVARLTREKKRWQDPAYVRTVAHERFGWVLPGEIGFQVLDDDGSPLGHTDSLSDAGAGGSTRPEWWASAWGSVVVAGRPQVDPEDVPRPATRIEAPKP